MTLNNTVLTPAAIYQSADFRVTRDDGSIIVDDSAKMVILQYMSWSGFVTYAGLGQCGGTDVSQFIVEWLEDLQGQPSMADIAACLEREGTSLLDGIRARSGRTFRLTFTLAGFEDNLVRAFVISNFEDYYGRPRSEIDDHLTTAPVLELRPGSDAAVITTGCPEAVTAADERDLIRLATDNPEDGGLIRRQMQALNAKASASSVTQNRVSQDCAVMSFRSDGFGRLELSDAQGIQPKQIPIINNGINQNKLLAEIMANFGIDMSSAQLDAATFVSTSPLGPASTPQPPCSFPATSTDPSGGYEIHEIIGADFAAWAAHDINDAGHVIGTGHAEQTVVWTTRDIPWLMQEGQVSKLNYDGSALAVNGSGHVAAMPQGEYGEGAALYSNGSVSVFPLYGADVELVAGTRSGVTAISDAGIVAGYVCTQTGHKMRAAAFRESHPPMVLTEPAAEHGARAVDINNKGQVLVLASLANLEIRSILWNLEDNSWRYVGRVITNVKPVAITDQGLILGVMNGTASLAVVCPLNGDWEQLGVASAWSPQDINDAGDVVGFVKQDGVLRPWLKLVTGEQLLLPYVAGHNTDPKAINNAGDIVGTAVSDKCGHAVIWRRG